MRTFRSDSATLVPEFGILTGRWTQYPTPDPLPFDAMWCVVPPASTSNRDCHPETEMVVVVSGSGRFSTPDDEPSADPSGRTVEAPQGTVVLLDSEEPHVIQNLSEDAPLVLLSIYWLPGQGVPEPSHDG